MRLLITSSHCSSRLRYESYTYNCVSVPISDVLGYPQALTCYSNVILQFLSMKLEAVNSRINMNPSFEGFHAKDVSMLMLIGHIILVSSDKLLA